MQKVKQCVLSCLFSLFGTGVLAGIPLWSFEPLTPTSIIVPSNATTLVQYRITNQSHKVHTLHLMSTPAIMQISQGANACADPFVLASKESCILSLLVNGSYLDVPIVEGPVVCQYDSTLQCYQPNFLHVLRAYQGLPNLDAVIRVTGSPLILQANGTGNLTIHNDSLDVAATNISSNFTGTALQGAVAETGNTCALVQPGASCTLTYTAGVTEVPQTNFPIQGTNTNTVTAAIAVVEDYILAQVKPGSGPTSGQTNVSLEGSGFSAPATVTFGGVSATNVQVLNSHAILATTPAHSAGAVDVVLSTPRGDVTLVNGYVYVLPPLKNH